MSPKTGLIPPPEVANAARKGLELRAKFHRGGTSVGLRRARQLAERQPTSFREIEAISDYFARHDDPKAHAPANDDNPSAGYIAWLLWGGDPAKKWADAIKAKAEGATPASVVRFPAKT